MNWAVVLVVVEAVVVWSKWVGAAVVESEYQNDTQTYNARSKRARAEGPATKPCPDGPVETYNTRFLHSYMTQTLLGSKKLGRLRRGDWLSRGFLLRKRTPAGGGDPGRQVDRRYKPVSNIRDDGFFAYQNQGVTYL